MSCHPLRSLKYIYYLNQVVLFSPRYKESKRGLKKKPSYNNNLTNSHYVFPMFVQLYG